MIRQTRSDITRYYLTKTGTALSLAGMLGTAAIPLCDPFCQPSDGPAVQGMERSELPLAPPGAQMPGDASTSAVDLGAEGSVDNLGGEAPISVPETTLAPDALANGSSAVQESFIDPTRYDVGATGLAGIDRTPALAATTLQAQPQGLTGTVTEVAPIAYSAPAETYSGAQDWSGSSVNPQTYYRRTARPKAFSGNGNMSLLFPLSIPSPITSLFGWRQHPISGDRRFHSGTDIGAPLGTPVLAAYAGQVAIADFMGGYGLTVTVNHNQGQQESLYAHLSEIFVKPGEVVKQGDVIGRVGSTGNSTGPHLHFEWRELTSEGWEAMDAGEQLQYALANFGKLMNVQLALPTKLPKPAQVPDSRLALSFGSLYGGLGGSASTRQLANPANPVNPANNNGPLLPANAPNPLPTSNQPVQVSPLPVMRIEQAVVPESLQVQPQGLPQPPQQQALQQQQPAADQNIQAVQ